MCTFVHMKTATNALERDSGPLRRLLRSEWLRPLNDPDHLDGWLDLLRPGSSLRENRLRVVERIEEAPGTWTFVLETNRRWPGFRWASKMC